MRNPIRRGDACRADIFSNNPYRYRSKLHRRILRRDDHIRVRRFSCAEKKTIEKEKSGTKIKIFLKNGYEKYI
jgi:hypothetical protein